MDTTPDNPEFRVGDVVALRSDRRRVGAVIEVLGGGAEVRYRVLIDGAVSMLYGSQVMPGDSTADSSVGISAEECKALLTPSTFAHPRPRI